MLVQNLTAQTFNKASVSPSVQATFPYMFAVSRYLQPGTFDLVGTIVYEIHQKPYQNTFYNGTVEVVEAGGFPSVESVFLVTLGIALLVLLALWLHGQLQLTTKGLLLNENIDGYLVEKSTPTMYTWGQIYIVLA
ncbi:translocon-associated protein subunit alpha-like isoform X2 [Gossypium arboreum]|uniref:translocon-associated protein subunit alpha-like isoform X2 n=1 Tax=Gossypium arboreum TaxID=29729 RepID=UPI0022F1C09E|nr:translocon-associated protein subunit alpha-like isoform X2 [Gossypium arboreum]